MTAESGNRAALYLRLSKDDEGQGESGSIHSQRCMLLAYAKERGFAVCGEYVDDGYSGTTFQRPGFQRLLEDIERGLVDLVLTKDLSRLGRDYIQVGQYTELYFPTKGVRFIAVNDGYDSAGPWRDLAPFQNLVNEMYARDASRKIRSALYSRMGEGEFVGPRAPYGYCRDPQNRHRLVPDEPAAGVVRELFRRSAQGATPGELARELTALGIPPPRASRSGNLSLPEGEIPAWSPATVGKILKNPVYLGHLVQGRSRKVSFKSPAVLPVPRGDWQVVEHTHEPLVSHGLFQLAAYGRRHRQCRAKGAFENRFAGLAFCGDCGRAMSTVSTRRRGAVANLACGGYKAGGRAACTNHFIDYEELCQVVCRLLRDALHLSQGEREKLLADAEESRRRQQEGPGQPRRKAVQIQISRLEQAIRTLYGDRVQGYLRPERMAALLENYERELDRWRAVLAALPTRPEEENPIPQALAQLEKRLEGGDPPWDLLRILVEEIQIFQGRYERQGETLVKRQSIRIRLRFQGQNTERTVTIG